MGKNEKNFTGEEGKEKKSPQTEMGGGDSGKKKKHA